MLSYPNRFRQKATRERHGTPLRLCFTGSKFSRPEKSHSVFQPEKGLASEFRDVSELKARSKPARETQITPDGKPNASCRGYHVMCQAPNICPISALVIAMAQPQFLIKNNLTTTSRSTLSPTSTSHRIREKDQKKKERQAKDVVRSSPLS